MSLRKRQKTEPVTEAPNAGELLNQVEEYVELMMGEDGQDIEIQLDEAEVNNQQQVIETDTVVENNIEKGNE